MLLRTSSASGLVLESAQPVRETDTDRPKKRSRWWLRPEMVFLEIAAALLMVVEIAGCYEQGRPIATVFAYLSVAIGIVFPLRTAVREQGRKDRTCTDPLSGQPISG